MSRKDVVGQNYTISFGVDHVTGAFVQLWHNPAYDQDCSFVTIDSDGVRINEAAAKGCISDKLRSYLLEEIADAFKHYKETHNDRPNIDESIVVTLAKIAGGFTDITAEVYRIFGDDI